MTTVLSLLIKGTLRLVGNAYFIVYCRRILKSFNWLHQLKANHKVQGHISDLSHKLTGKLYRYFMLNEVALKILLAVLLVHINVSVFIVILKCGKSARARYITTLVYLSKFALNLLYESTPPAGRYNRRWSPSKVLYWTENAKSETFFSGHTSLCALAVLFAPKSLYIHSIIGACITIPSLIILRIHYIIDIVGAFLFVYFFNNIFPA